MDKLCLLLESSRLYNFILSMRKIWNNKLLLEYLVKGAILYGSKL